MPMIALHEPDATIFVAAIAAIPATIAAVAALRASKQGRRNRDLLQENRAEMATGNEKNLGETVHDLAQTTEIIVAQSHTNTSELLGLRDDHRALAEKFDEHLENVRAVMEEHEGVWAEMEKIYEARAKKPEGKS